MQKQSFLFGNFSKLSKTGDSPEQANCKNETFCEIKRLANYFLKKEQLATLDSFLECMGNENKRRLFGEKEFLENYLKLLLKDGRFENAINILKAAEDAREPVFLSLWDEAHYMWEQALFDTPCTPLTPIQKFRIRKSICPDGTRPQTRMTVDDKDAMKAWLLRHRDHPYPTRSQKAQMSEETGLTVQQVATWFGNARRRLGSRRKQKQAEQGLKLAQKVNCPESLEEVAAKALQEMKAVSEELGANRRKGWTVGTRSEVADQRAHFVPAEYSPQTGVASTTMTALKELCLRVSRETVSPRDAAITIVKDMKNDTKNTSDMIEYNEDEKLKLDEVYLGVDLRRGSDDVTKHKLDDENIDANAKRVIDEMTEVSEGFEGAVQVQFVEVEVETSTEGLALVGMAVWENLWAANELYDTDDKILGKVEAIEPSFERRMQDYADRGSSSGLETISAPRQTVTSVRQASIQETAQFVNQPSAPIPVSMFENQAASVEEVTSSTRHQAQEVTSDMSVYQTQVPEEMFQNETNAVETAEWVNVHQPSVTEQTAVLTLYSVDSAYANPMRVNPSTLTESTSMSTSKHQEEFADPATVCANQTEITEPVIDLTQPTQSLMNQTSVPDSANVFENNSDVTEIVIDLTQQTSPLRNHTTVTEMASAFKNESSIYTEAMNEREYNTMVAESSVVYENQTVVTDSPAQFGNQTMVSDSPAEFGNQTTVTVTEPMEVAWGNQSARAVSSAICEHHARFAQPGVLEEQAGISAVTAEIPACSSNTLGASDAVQRETMVWEAVTALGNLSAVTEPVREDNGRQRDIGQYSQTNMQVQQYGLAASGYPVDDTMRLEHHGSGCLWKDTCHGRDYGTVLGEAIQGLLTLSTPHGAHANMETAWNQCAVSNMQY